MAMSWGWTPICQIGNNRYRISSSAGDQLQPTSSRPLPGTSCTITSIPQLPAETSVILSTPVTGVSRSLSTAPSARPPIASTVSNGPVATSNPASSAGDKERLVRRSPRLANASRVTYREDSLAQSSVKQNQVNDKMRDQGMSNSAVANNSNQNSVRPDFSVYNYDGQAINSSSLSVIYNNSRNSSNTAPQFRYLTAVPYVKPAAPVAPVSNFKKKKVSIRQLDFYKHISTLVQSEVVPSGVGPTQHTFSFMLSSVLVRDLMDKKRQHPYLIQLRFCKLDNTCEQNDYYPATHQVAINHRLILLPGLETMPRGSMRPMDITALCILNSQSCNFITVRCFESCMVNVSVVQKYTSKDLLKFLEAKPFTKHEDTVVEIKKKLQADQADDGIAAATLQFSLLCPLSRIRIKLPCRASTCNHLQCFDAATYLQLNECKPKWSCPVCYQAARYNDLLIDGYFKKIVDENLDDDKIELQPDGSWTLVNGVKKQSSEMEKVKEELTKDGNTEESADKTVVLDSDDDETSSQSEIQTIASIPPPPPRPPHRSDSPEVVELSDDDTLDEDTPQITGSTFPANTTATSGVVANNPVNSGFDNLSNISLNEIIGRGFNNFNIQLDRLPERRVSSYNVMNNSNSIYANTRIPVIRTEVLPQITSTVTVSSRNNRDSRTNLSRKTQKNREANKVSQEKTDKSKKGKLKDSRKRKLVENTSKTKKSGEVKLRKRIRLPSVSSDFTDSESESESKSRSKLCKRDAVKKKAIRNKRDGDSSRGKSRGSSSSSTKSSSLRLVSSSEESRSESSSISSSGDSSNNSSEDSSSSSSDSSSDKAEASDDSLSSLDLQEQVEPSSRVLRSTRQKKKKSK